MACLSVGLVVRHEVMNLDKSSWFMLDGLETLFVYTIGLLFAIPTSIRSFKAYRKSSSRSFLIPVVIIGIGIISALGIHLNNILNDSPVILTANYDGGTNGLTLKLKADNSYTLENSGIYGSDFLEGLYTIDADTIRLVPSSPTSSDLIGNKLIIVEKKIIYQLDQNNQYDKSIPFDIHLKK